MSLADRLAKAQQKDRIAEVRIRVQERLVESLGPRLYDATLSDTELEGMVHQRLRELLDEEEGPLAAQEKLLIVRQIGDSVLGLGPLEPYIRDPEVTEVMVNNWDTIYVERVMKINVDAMIPSSRLVPTSLNKGRPVVLDEPNSEVAQAVRQLAGRFAGQAEAAAAGEAAVDGAGPKKKKRLFARS